MSLGFKKNPANPRWLLLFGLWFLFLTGGLAKFVSTPGILQAVRLKGLLQSKQEQLNQIRTDLQKLETEVSQLEHNKIAQIREIRRVLGYAAQDEIIFDFTHSE